MHIGRLYLYIHVSLSRYKKKITEKSFDKVISLEIVDRYMNTIITLTTRRKNLIDPVQLVNQIIEKKRDMGQLYLYAQVSLNCNYRTKSLSQICARAERSNYSQHLICMIIVYLLVHLTILRAIKYKSATTSQQYFSLSH